MKTFCTSILFSATLLVSSGLSATTIIAVTKGASADGSVYVAANDDDQIGDPRIVHVPPLRHMPNKKRPIYATDDASFPRLVCTDRGRGYNTPNLKLSTPIGFIPQEEKTYGYFDGNYGIMNEHRLMVAGCHNLAKVRPDAAHGKRMLHGPALSRIALERCQFAKHAVRLMGNLVNRYGYYGSGETIVVADPEEVWVFEVCGGTMDNVGGLWVARKVPNGEVFVAANRFTIREVDSKSGDIMHSDNLFKTIQTRGWWKDSDGKLDWAKAVSAGEVAHPYFSLRRIWRLQSLMAPGLKLPAEVEDPFTKVYPFSFKPEKKPSSFRDLAVLLRDEYRKTPYDMSKGVAAGPYGCPSRDLGSYDPSTAKSAAENKSKGAWERPISLQTTNYSTICQSRSHLPVPIGGIAWIAFDTPTTSCYLPAYVGVNSLPLSFHNGSPAEFSRESTWWAFDFVNNWAKLKYQYMMPDIITKQNEIEEGQLTKQIAVENAAEIMFKRDPKAVQEYLTEYCINNAASVTKQWWQLADQLIAKFNDGRMDGKAAGYPTWWLKASDYSKGPVEYGKKVGDR